jgi:vibriolysin
MNRPQRRPRPGARYSIPQRVLVWLLFTAALYAGSPAAQERVPKVDSLSDVTAALAALPDALVLDSSPDGLPRHIVGDLARVDVDSMNDPATAEAALRAVLAGVVAPLRISPSDLRLRGVRRDGRGGTHFRFRLVADGLDVIGGDLVVHIDAKGSVAGVNGAGRGDVSRLPPARLTRAEAIAWVAADPRFAGLAFAGSRPVLLVTEAGTRHRALEILVVGARGKDPVRDRVYVDLMDGSIAAVDPQLRFAKSRQTYTAGNGTSLPGSLRRSEGQAATTDLDINGAYDNTGAFYDAFAGFWGRDSYDDAGARLSSTVHYATNYCNAFWDGTQMVFGDGLASAGCLPLARVLDLTAHELTHAITERESGLIYSGESGAINESLSDSFAAFVEAWVAGGGTGTLTPTPDTWLYGESALPPFVRSMCDPAADGASADVWSSSVGNLDVHYGSGVGNLAFCLLADGGTHPRGKTTVVVPSIGLEKAIRILYEAQASYMTSTTTYAGARTAMEQAAAALGYDQATEDAVGCAWGAVGVGSAPASCGGSSSPPPPTDGTLRNDVPVSGLSGATGEKAFWSLAVPAGQSSVSFSISGGTGDADLYVQSGTKPTLSSYSCRPYLNGNNETCVFLNPVAGTWWVMLNAYTGYAGATLKGKYLSGLPGGDPALANGVPVAGLSGAMHSNQFWRINTPAGKTLKVKISGGTGDADLYVRFGAHPTTSSYACRPYLNGNNETGNLSNTSAGDYYVRLRGYTSYSGVSLVGSF